MPTTWTPYGGARHQLLAYSSPASHGLQSLNMAERPYFAGISGVLRRLPCDFWRFLGAFGLSRGRLRYAMPQTQAMPLPRASHVPAAMPPPAAMPQPAVAASRESPQSAYRSEM